MAEVLNAASGAKPVLGQATQVNQGQSDQGIALADRPGPYPTPAGEATPSSSADELQGVNQNAVPEPWQRGAQSFHTRLMKPDGDGRQARILWPQRPLREKEIDFAELDDGSLVELVEDPRDPTRTLLAVWKDGQVSYTNQLEHGGQILRPLDRDRELLKYVRLPRGAKLYNSSRDLLREVEALLSRCVVLEEIYINILADFVASTWLVDRLPIAPYVLLVGRPQSGKTTLLKVLSLVCRRSLLTADITSAAFLNACARLTPTLLIDETGTHGSNRFLRHLLRMGTTRDVVAMRKNQTFHAYGAKVISFLEPPDDPALTSRCILIPMTEANNPSLSKPTDADVQALGAELQQRLLQFRFDRYKDARAPEIPGAERLRSRARDLLNCLAIPSSHNPDYCKFLLEFFEVQALSTVEPLLPAENAVLKTLYREIHGVPEDIVSVSDLTQQVNNLLKECGEQLRLKPRKVGAVLTSLGLVHRQRTSYGWQVWLTKEDQRLIHRLVETYGKDGRGSYVLIPPDECELCREVRENQAPTDSAKRGTE